MNAQTVNTTLFSSMHPDVAKRTSVPALLFSIVMLLAGFLAFASIFEMSDKSSAVSMMMMVAGTSLILWGIFRLFWRTKELVYLPTGSVARERTLFFSQKDLEQLTDMLEHGTPVTGVRSESSGNVRLNVMLSQDNRFAAVQLFQFIPYSYTPVTPVRYFTGSDAAAIASFLKQSKAA